MTPLRQQMTAALELNGKSPATVEAYVRKVALVSKFYRKRPDQISEEELVRYLLHRKNADRLAPSSMRICYSGLRFFYQRVLGWEWKIFTLLGRPTGTTFTLTVGSSASLGLSSTQRRPPVALSHSIPDAAPASVHPLTLEALPISPPTPSAGLLEHGIEATLKVASILSG